MASTRQFFGNLVDWAGTRLGAGGGGWSERIAGGPTTRTGEIYERPGGVFQPRMITPEPYSQVTPQVLSAAGLGGQVLPASTGQDMGGYPKIDPNAGGGGGGGGGQGGGGGGGGGVNQGNLLQNFPGYAGWGSAEAWGDYLATGGAGKGGGGQGGGDQGGGQQQNAYFDQLDKMLGGLGGTQSDLEGQVQNLFGSQSQSIGTGLQGALGGLEQSRQGITSNKVSSLRDLDVDMRNQLKAGNIYLGARGASDSSATNQYALALGKAGSQNRATILKQANELYSQVDNQVTQAKSLAQDELQKLETWKNNNLLQISQYIQSLRGNIDQAKAQYIQEQLAALDNKVNFYKETVANWITQKATSLSGLQQQLQQLGVGPGGSFTQPQTPGLTMGGQQGYTPDYYGRLGKEEKPRL